MIRKMTGKLPDWEYLADTRQLSVKDCSFLSVVAEDSSLRVM
jgi:hypothetical protein